MLCGILFFLLGRLVGPISFLFFSFSPPIVYLSSRRAALQIRNRIEGKVFEFFFLPSPSQRSRSRGLHAFNFFLSITAMYQETAIVSFSFPGGAASGRRRHRLFPLPRASRVSRKGVSFLFRPSRSERSLPFPYISPPPSFFFPSLRRGCSP